MPHGSLPRFPRRPHRLETRFQNMPPFYFITFNSHKRMPLLANDAVANIFKAFCTKACNHGIAVGHYVIMPDHVHMFVMLPAEKTLSRWMQSLKSTMGKALLTQGVDKPHWQEGFFDHLLRSTESYAEKWQYVWMNPVRAGLCRHPDDWPYKGSIVPIAM